MGNLFKRSKPPPSRVTEQDKAVLQLKQQRDKLKQYQKKINLALERERLVAKQLLAEGKKDKALLLLRKKKYQEGLIDKTDNQLHNIEELIHDLEYTQIESQVLEGLKNGNLALKKMHAIMSLEDVERIMDETSESVEYQRQISDLLSGGLTDEDEQDVMDELNELLASESEAQAVQPASAAEAEGVDISLPDVPDDELPSEVDIEGEGERVRHKNKNKPAKQAVLAS